MKVTLEFAAGNGETLNPDAYVPKRGERVPFVGTGHVGEVIRVTRWPRKVRVELRVKASSWHRAPQVFEQLPGVTP